MSVLVWFFFRSSYRAQRFVYLALNNRLLRFMETAEGYENAASFKERFEQELARAKRHNGALTVLVVNAAAASRQNHANPLENPTFLGNLLRKLRREDIKGRFSSDRLAFLLVETDKELAGQVCERFHTLFQSIAQGESAGLQVGIGLASYPLDGDSVQTLLQYAEGDALVRKSAGSAARSPLPVSHRSAALRNGRSAGMNGDAPELGVDAPAAAAVSGAAPAAAVIAAPPAKGVEEKSLKTLPLAPHAVLVPQAGTGWPGG
jgi:predicted signal transduction protein with EAL and GGDEF domain